MSEPREDRARRLALEAASDCLLVGGASGLLWSAWAAGGLVGLVAAASVAAVLVGYLLGVRGVGR